MKLASISILIMFLTPLLSCCQNEQKNNEGYLYLSVDTSGAITTYAYKNDQGRIIIPFGKYYMCFTDTIKTIGFVAVSGKGYWAIDKNDSLLLKVYPYDNGPDYVREGLFRIIDKDGLIGFGNMNGEVAIQPSFKRVDPFHEGLSSFCDDCLYEPVVGPSGEVDLKSRGTKLRGKYGFINRVGKVVIAPKFDLTGLFHDGIARVWIGDRSFYIDQNGNEVVTPK